MNLSGPGGGTRLTLRQTQSTVLSPAMHQAIKLLQLSAQDLDLFIREALEGNPFLLQESESDTGSEQATAARPRLRRYSNGTLAPDPALARILGERFSVRGGSRVAETGGHVLPPDAAAQPSLRDHVAREAGALFVDPADRQLAEILADSLDEAGYLGDSLEALAARHDVDETRLAAILSRLQEIEPPGLFARDLAECLALQLADRGQLDQPMQDLLDHLDLLGAGDFDRLAQACDVGPETLQDMIARLRGLDPRPGLAFAPEEAVPIVADLVAVRENEGSGANWRVVVSPALVPRLFIDRQYYDRIRSAAKSEDKTYLSDQLRSARWLIRALDQRSETMLAVATEIVRRQQAFLADGVAALVPMVLRDIAAALEIHESTVSRAIAGKYIETPMGVYELSYFFSTAVADAGGGPPHSARAVKARLKALIESETRPTSDAKLAEKLHHEGFDLARRTVAKYREELGLPASSKRRHGAGRGRLTGA